MTLLGQFGLVSSRTIPIGCLLLSCSFSISSSLLFRLRSCSSGLVVHVRLKIILLFLLAARVVVFVLLFLILLPFFLLLAFTLLVFSRFGHSGLLDFRTAVASSSFLGCTGSIAFRGGLPLPFSIRLSDLLDIWLCRLAQLDQLIKRVLWDVDRISDLLDLSERKDSLQGMANTPQLPSRDRVKA